MSLVNFKNLTLLTLVALVIFYLIVSVINLGLRLTATRQPECNPIFCKEIANEASYCLLSTPGAENCLKVAGWFFVPSPTLAYLLLLISFGLALFISKRFYLFQWFILLTALAIGIYSVRVFLGAASFSIYGIIYEFQKLGLITA